MTKAKIVFTGTIEKCVEHFSKHFSLAEKNRTTWQKRQAIGRMLGVSALTIKAWFTTGKLPEGENLIKLQLLLTTMGYRINDAPTLAPAIGDLHSMIGTRTIPVAEIAKKLEINPQQVFSYVLRGQDPLPPRKEAIRVLVEACRGAWRQNLEERELKLRELGLCLTNPPKPLAAKSAEANGKDKRPPDTNAVRPEVMLLAQLINAAAPLAERVASNEFTARDRQILRQLTQAESTNYVFGLSNNLNRCCGERARAQLEDKEQV